MKDALTGMFTALKFWKTTPSRLSSKKNASTKPKQWPTSKDLTLIISSLAILTRDVREIKANVDAFNEIMKDFLRLNAMLSKAIGGSSEIKKEDLN